MTDEKIYFINRDGLFEMDPFTGETKNLIEGAGSIARYFATYETDTAFLTYSPKERMVLVSLRQTGDSVNDRLLCYHVPMGAFYLKKNILASCMSVVDNQVYAGSATTGEIFQVFDESRYTNSAGGATRARALLEWDGIDEIKQTKTLKVMGMVVSLNPNSSLMTKVYKDGFTEAVTSNTETVTSLEVGCIVGELGEYQLALGEPNDNLNTSKLLRFPQSERFASVAVEVSEESIYNFELHSLLLEVLTSEKLIPAQQMSDGLF